MPEIAEHVENIGSEISARVTEAFRVGSSMVEQRPFKALVLGSSPSQPTLYESLAKTHPAATRCTKKHHNGRNFGSGLAAERFSKTAIMQWRNTLRAAFSVSPAFAVPPCCSYQSHSFCEMGKR
jgi:hypothetical protein